MTATISQKYFNPERQLYEFDVLSPTNEVVGMAQLRLVPSKGSDMPKGFESNVYYEVNEDQRGKGYATDALGLVLKEAAKHNLKSITATVNADNIPSIKVIEKCGGNLEFKAKTTKGIEVLKYSLPVK